MKKDIHKKSRIRDPSDRIQLRLHIGVRGSTRQEGMRRKTAGGHVTGRVNGDVLTVNVATIPPPTFHQSARAGSSRGKRTKWKLA